MEEEPIPKKIESKSEEEIRNAVKEELKEEIKEEIQNEEKKKRSVFSIISRLFFTILFLFFLFETIIGVINMQRLNDDKEPVWYISSETKESNGKRETIYNLGLYVVVKTTESNQSKTTLKPFFLK